MTLMLGSSESVRLNGLLSIESDFTESATPPSDDEFFPYSVKIYK